MKRRSSKIVSLARLKKKLDKVHHEWVRLRDYGNDCMACGGSAKNGHASHYYASTFTATRWDDRNVNLCCVKCNVFLHGNLLEYRKGMIQKYGQEVVDELERLHNQEFKLDREWLQEKIGYYSKLIKS